MFNNGGIVPVMNVDGNNNNGMWGGDCWWAWILLFAIFGWGNNGMWGNNGGNNNCCCNSNSIDAALQRGFDNQTVVNKLNGLENGICSLGYDQLSQMNSLNNTVQQTGWNLQQTMNQNAIASMQQAWAAQQQASDCCCENRVGQMNIMNTMDKNNCATIQAINQNGQNLMWANQQGFRDISDQINAGFQRIEMNQKDAQIASLTQRLNDCNLENALRANAEYITGRCCPRSEPAYLTCNPNTGNVFPQSGLDQLAYQQWQMSRNGNCCNQNNYCNNQGF